MSKTIWIVMERGSEYNDEYYPLNEEGGDPIEGYVDPEIANRRAKELQAESFKTSSPFSHNEDAYYVTNCRKPSQFIENFRAIAEKHSISPEQIEAAFPEELPRDDWGWEWMDWTFPDWPLEILIELCSLFDLNTHYVEKIEVHE